MYWTNPYMMQQHAAMRGNPQGGTEGQRPMMAMPPPGYMMQGQKPGAPGMNPGLPQNPNINPNMNPNMNPGMNPGMNPKMGMYYPMDPRYGPYMSYPPAGYMPPKKAD